MKIASYNIMSGGFNDYEKDTKSPPRLELIKAAVSEIDADIIGLVDTYRWDEIYSTADLSRLFDYPFATQINLNDDRLRAKGHNNGLVILSRLPFIKVETLRIHTRDALQVLVSLDGAEIAINLTYLDDLDENTRKNQTQALLNQLPVSTPSIIMGDLNSLHPRDKPNLESLLAKIYVTSQELKAKLRPALTKMRPGSAIRLIEGRGFCDADENSTPTFPTQLFPLKISPPFLRLDYCFYSSELTVDDFCVLDSDLLQQTSDHLPIACTIAVR